MPIHHPEINPVPEREFAVRGRAEVATQDARPSRKDGILNSLESLQHEIEAAQSVAEHLYEKITPFRKNLPSAPGASATKIEPTDESGMRQRIEALSLQVWALRAKLIRIHDEIDL